MSTRTSERSKMKNKNIVLFLASAIVLASAVGCAGPRTGSVGYKDTPAVVRTQVTGTVTTETSTNGAVKVTRTENYTTISTPPVPERTWKEKVFGQRPPGATSPTYVPPFPSGGGGASATAVTPTSQTTGTQRGAQARGSYGGSYGAGSNLSIDQRVDLYGRAAFGQPNPQARPWPTPGNFQVQDRSVFGHSYQSGR